jgi:hypothetical protein
MLLVSFCARMSVAHRLQAIAACLRRGFTKFSRDDYVQWKREGRFVKDGVNAKVHARN